MTFLTRVSKHVLSKRSAKMIDGTEKPKVCKTHIMIQLNHFAIRLIINKGYRVQVTTIIGQNAFAPTLCFT